MVPFRDFLLCHFYIIVFFLFANHKIFKYFFTLHQSLLTNHYSLKKLPPKRVRVLCLVVPRRVEQRWFRLSDEPAVLISASSLAFLAKKANQEPQCNARYNPRTLFGVFISKIRANLLCQFSHLQVILIGINPV